MIKILTTMIIADSCKYRVATLGALIYIERFGKMVKTSDVNLFLQFQNLNPVSPIR